jgi:cytochrome c oxidase cbb3-type subunit 3
VKEVKNNKEKINLKDSAKEPKTTGHEWDGITEYDNPDPFWLRILFYAMLFFSLIYWILYPATPAQYNRGALDWSEYKETERGLEGVRSIREQYLAEFDKANFDEILKDPKLLKFAIAGGRSAFNNNCAVCHGVGGGGQPGYPNLAAGMWLWGGKPDDIYTTIKHGIRSTDDETRQSQMAAFGKDKILTSEQIELLTDFVIGLHEGKKGSEEATKLFSDNCATCHGPNGEGGREFGAPRLNTPIWLYDGDRETVRDVIYNGRSGVMPNWQGRLDDSTIRQLVIYVHQLGGGE